MIEKFEIIEDKSRFWNENAHVTLNILRKYALFLHKQYILTLPKNISAKKNMLNCLMKDSLLLKVFGNDNFMK